MLARRGEPVCSPGIALRVFAGQTHRSATTVVGVFTPPSLRFACATSSINRGELKFLYFTLKLKIQGRMHSDRGVRIVRPGVRYIRRDGTKKHMRHPARDVA